jgi:hypothetical protein
MGKITVKHYLNTKLKGHEENGVTHYPLYVQITYNRKNTNFASEYNQRLSQNIDLEELKTSIVAGNILKEEARVITDIIHFESTLRGDTFDLKDLKNKYEFYKKPLHSLLNNYLVPKVGKFMSMQTECKPFDSIYNFSYKSDLFFAPSVNFEDYLFSIKKTIPDFMSILNKEVSMGHEFIFSSNKASLHQEIKVYETFCRFCKPELSFSSYPTPRLIDWLNGKFKKAFSLFLTETLLQQNDDIATTYILEQMILDHSTLLY